MIICTAGRPYKICSYTAAMTQSYSHNLACDSHSDHNTFPFFVLPTYHHWELTVYLLSNTSHFMTDACCNKIILLTSAFFSLLFVCLVKCCSGTWQTDLLRMAGGSSVMSILTLMTAGHQRKETHKDDCRQIQRGTVTWFTKWYCYFINNDLFYK